MFRVAAAIALAGFALGWLLPQRPLRETLAAPSGDRRLGPQILPAARQVE